MSFEDYISNDIRERYEIHDFKHAAVILAKEFPAEFADICDALLEFNFAVQDVTKPGGNESEIPRRFSRILRPKGWKERSLKAKVVVDDNEVSHDTHKVDYLKGRVAVDLEWNSKDQTFDRDLYAFRTFFEYDKISVSVLITRSNELDPWFESLGAYLDKHGTRRSYKSKFGASTTHNGQIAHAVRIW